MISGAWMRLADAAIILKQLVWGFSWQSAVEDVRVRSGRYRLLRRRRVRGRQPAGKSRGTDPLARGRSDPTQRAGNRRSRENPDCRAENRAVERTHHLGRDPAAEIGADP